MNLLTADVPAQNPVDGVNVVLEPLTRPYRKMYLTEYAEQAHKLCLLDLDDSELAEFLIPTSTHSGRESACTEHWLE